MSEQKQKNKVQNDKNYTKLKHFLLNFNFEQVEKVKFERLSSRRDGTGFNWKPKDPEILSKQGTLR